MKYSCLSFGIFLSVLITGCATTSENGTEEINSYEVNKQENRPFNTENTIENEIDPWENWNRKIQSMNDNMDDNVLKPVAKGYRWIMPTIVDTAITNVFSNIKDINVTFNDLLQGKFYQSSQDAARFLINSTAGFGGLLDVASVINLPRHKEDFGQTLGVWGVPTGPYMVLPLFGPSSPRGAIGIIGDAATNPVSYIGMPFVSGGVFVGETIDKRADNLGTEKIANEAAAFGRYEFFRDAYVSQRKSLVYDGNIPEGDDDFLELDDDFDEDFN